MAVTKDFKEFLVYLDGKMVPESEAKISIFDRGFHGGDSFHEAIRSFKGKLFKLSEHTARLFRSLWCARIDAHLNPAEMEKISQNVLDANRHLMKENEDFWILQQISSGIVPQFEREGVRHKDCTVIVFAFPLPFRKYARYYEVGAHAVTSWTRRISPQCLDPKIKTSGRPHFYIASREVKLIDPNAYCLLLDEWGNISEGLGYNFFIVSNGTLKTPGLHNVLEGISRETVMELAEEMNIPYEEGDLQTYHVYNADEAFLTATSFCILPVTKFNGLPIGEGRPGPITKSLLDTWSKKVGVDIVNQALGYLKE